jgi:hypothetical protein
MNIRFLRRYLNAHWDESNKVENGKATLLTGVVIARTVFSRETDGLLPLQ